MDYCNRSFGVSGATYRGQSLVSEDSLKKGRSQSLMMFNEACDHSPTGYITTNPEDLFSRRYRRGNSESVRHLSVRVRVAEEEVKKYRLQNEDLKKTVAKMNKELCDKQYEMESLRKTFEQQVDDLQHQLSKKEREDKQSKFEAIMSLLQGSADPPKIYEPPFSFLDEPKSETVNVEAQTDDWMLRSIQKSINAAVAGSSVISKCRADNESSDAEKCGKMAEEIAKLENEKFFLTTQLKLTRNKLENFELQEAQKTSLENRLIILTEMNECLVKENERIKEMTASKMDAGVGTMEEKRRIIDSTLKYQAKLDEIQMELDWKSQKLQEQLQINQILSVDLENVKKKLNAGNCEDSGLIQNGAEVLKRYENEISELKKKLAQYDELSDPSVKILHMKMNPLDTAYQEYKEFQANRKRKLNESLSFLNEDNDDLIPTLRKKQRDEMVKQIADLQFQLHKVEKENERALKIQSNLVKKYRAFVTALSGLQIKMKEDDLVQVESIFDPGNYFIFKVHDYGKTISLLETDYAMQWTAQIREYLEGRNSTPAFLAAITLILDERAGSTTTMSFYPSD
uniref:Spindle assembly checkpoint component MAD1 n=1 Tax=Onchocerca volvulus TaxID=6282 RepID=A0A8R1XYT2_ONCVO